MKDIIDVRGASGAAYRFTRFREGNPLSAMGGNFVYARETDDVTTILFVGEAQNLLTGAQSLWDDAVRGHGAEGLYTRLNISERTRQAEHSDILAALATPMNTAAPAAPSDPT
jgi:hypothetical protein